MVTPFEQSILDGQISYWLNAKLTIDGDLELRSTNHLILPQDNDAVTPTLAFGDGDTGLYEYTDDVIRVSINGSPKLQINATQISSVDTSVWALLRKTATHIIPNIVPREDDLNTGVGHAEPDALSLIAGGVEGHRITEAAGLITHVLTGDVSVTGDLDVSGAITGGTIPIENLYDVDKQSFENLLDNGEFKLWPAGGSSLPAEWEKAGSGNIEQDSVDVPVGTSAVKITYIADVAIFQNLPNYSQYKGKVVTIAALVKASSINQIRISIADGVGFSYSNYHSGGGDWEVLTVSRLVDSTATRLTPQANLDASGSAYVCGMILVKGSICPAFSPKPLTDPTIYGEMYIYNNSNATVIETADTPIALRQISEGLQKGFIFHAGSTGAITAYADYSGTVAGTVLVTDAGHGLSTGDIITIRGSTNYNGIFAVTVVSVDTFYITDTWVNDNGASDWDQGASLTAQPGADGVYTSTWQMTTAPAGACEVCFKVNINNIPQNKSTACRDLAINDKDNNSSTCLMDIVEGDIIWLSVQSDATSDITNSMGNMNLERM